MGCNGFCRLKSTRKLDKEIFETTYMGIWQGGHEQLQHLIADCCVGAKAGERDLEIVYLGAWPCGGRAGGGGGEITKTRLK